MTNEEIDQIIDEEINKFLEENSKIKKLEDMVIKTNSNAAKAALFRMSKEGKYNMARLKQRMRDARMSTNEEFEETIDEKRKKKKKKKKKQDACYHKVKSRYAVWPSAYASGALVKCRKVGAKNWGNKSKKK